MSASSDFRSRFLSATQAFCCWRSARRSVAVARTAHRPRARTTARSMGSWWSSRMARSRETGPERRGAFSRSRSQSRRSGICAGERQCRTSPWSGVRHETEFSLGCAQLADQGAPASANEDCLYLNVWSPEPAPDKAPVMVWIHGGGNFSGGAGIPIPLDEQALVRRPGLRFATGRGAGDDPVPARAARVLRPPVARGRRRADRQSRATRSAPGARMGEGQHRKVRR